jgi:hypothetical protein
VKAIRFGGSAASTALALAVVVAAALVAGRTLLQPGFYDSHDGLLNVHRLFELEKCLADGQIPCRWAPDMGGGYGYPLFVFYPPLSTWIAEGFRALGVSFLGAVKGAMLLALVVAGVSMFALARRFFGLAGGLLSAGVYTFAPYLAIDVFVRGALAEVWGMALLPLIFLTSQRAMAAPGRGLAAGLGCAFAWAALLMTHGITALMAAPFQLAWTLLWAARAHALGLALAAWFVLPALLELQYVHSETLTSLYPWARFENNFLSPGELLLGGASWGHGPFGTPDGMKLFVGPLQLGLGLLAIAGMAVRAARGAGGTGNATAEAEADAGANTEEDSARAAGLLLGGSALVAAFLTLPLSRPVWEIAAPLAFLQFPWRFLAIASLGFAFAAGWLAFALRARPKASWALTAAACIAALVLGLRWFQPAAMYDVRPEALANELAVARARHGLYDFLPKSVDLERFRASQPPPPALPAEGASPGVRVVSIERTSDRVEVDAVMEGSEPGLLRVNVFAFPGWTLEIDGEPTELAESDDPYGRLHVELPPGARHVVARFENTPIRTASAWLSLAALLSGSVWLIAALRTVGTSTRARRSAGEVTMR